MHRVKMRTEFHVKSIKLDVFKYVNMHEHVSNVEKFENGTLAINM